MTTNYHLAILTTLNMLILICYMARTLIWAFKYRKHFPLSEFLRKGTIGAIAISSLIYFNYKNS